MSGPRFTVYLEDPPLRPEIPGRGLARLNSALLAGLLPQIDRIFLLPLHSHSRPDDWDSRFSAHSTRLPDWHRLAIKAARRAGGDFGERAIGPSILRVALKSWRANRSWMFAPIGSTITMAERALAAASAIGAQPILYFVDDPLAAQEAAGLAGSALERYRARVAAATRRAALCFALTDALAETVRGYGGQCALLPLPFEPRPIPAIGSMTQEVIHVGAANHIYASGLVTTARAMARTNLGLQLRLTSQPDGQLMDALQAIVPVRVAEAAGSGAFEALLASAFCAVVPVEREATNMYATSFPSKLLEYLNACQRIIVLGPEDASAVRYFRAAALPEIAQGEIELARQLTTFSLARPNYHAAYSAALHRYNSPEAFAETINAAISARSL